MTDTSPGCNLIPRLYPRTQPKFSLHFGLSTRVSLGTRLSRVYDASLVPHTLNLGAVLSGSLSL